MAIRKRITTPGVSDNQWASILCTPSISAVDFHELEDEALEAANANLAPSTSVYVAQVKHQGEHGKKGTANHFAVVIELTDEQRRRLARYNGARSAKAVVDTLKAILERGLKLVLDPPRPEEPEIHEDATVCKPLDTALLAQAGKAP